MAEEIVYISEGRPSLTQEALDKELEFLGIDSETFLKQYGYSVKGNGVAVTDASVTLGNNQASNGDSSLVNGSSEPQEIDPFLITIEDLRTTEEIAAPAISKKLARVGIQVEQSLMNDALTFTNEQERDDEFSNLNPVMDWLENSIGDLSRAIRIGEDKSDEELQKAADTINAYIKEKGNFKFVEEANKRNKSTYVDEYIPYVTPPVLSDEQLDKDLTNYKIEKFNQIRDDKTIMDEFGKRIIPATIKDFKNEKEFLEYEQYQETGVLNEITDTDRKIYNLERKNKYTKERSSEWANDSDDDVRLDIMALAQDDVAQLQNFGKVNKDFDIKAKEFEYAFNDYELNPSIETYDTAFKLQNDLLIDQARLQGLQNKLIEQGLDDRADYIPLAISDFNKNYSRLEQLSTAFKTTAATVGYGLAVLGQIANDPLYFAMPAAVNSEKLNRGTGLVDLISDLNVETAGYQETMGVGDIGSISDAGRWVAGTSMNLIPSLAMATTGPAALPLFFLSGFGGATSDMAVQQQDAATRMLSNKKLLDEGVDMDFLSRAMIEGEMQKDAKLLKIENWRILSNAALHGIAEVAFEKVGTIAIFKSLKTGIQGMPPWALKEGFAKAGSIAYYGGKQITKGVLQEGGSEFATTLVQNFGDIYILGEDKNFFEGGLESFAGGALMGGGMKSINAFKAVHAGIASELETKEQRKRMIEIVEELRKLTGVNELTNVGQLKKLGAYKNLPQEIKDQVDKLESEGTQMIDQIIQMASVNLSEEQIYEIGSINQKMRYLNQQLMNAVANPNIGADQMKAYEAELRKEFNKLELQKDGILTNEGSIAENQKNSNVNSLSFDNTMGYSFYNAAMQNESVLNIFADYNNLSEFDKQDGFGKAATELIAEGIENPTPEQIKERAQQSYVDNVYKEKIDKGEANAKKFAENNLKNPITIQSFEGKDKNKGILNAYESAGATVAEMAEMARMLADGTFEGVSKGSTIIVDRDASIKNRRIGIYAHEVLHAYAIENGLNENEAGKNLLTWLEANDKDMFAKVKFRIDQNNLAEENVEGPVDKDGQIKGEDYYLEALNAMSDVIADGQQLQVSTTNQIRLWYNNIVGNKFPSLKLNESQGEMAAMFVKDFNKMAHQGKDATISLEQLEKNTAEETIDKSKLSQTKLSPEKRKEVVNKNVTENPQWQTAKDPFLQTPRGQRVMGQIISPFMPVLKSIQQSKSSMFDTATFEGDAQSLQAAKDDAIMEAVLQVINHVNNFNPAENNDLDAWINSYIERKYLSGVKKIEKKTFTQRTDTSTNEIVEEDAIEKVDKPTYRSLTESKIVSPKAFKDIAKSVLSTTRVLKSTLSEVGSINKTTTDLINEIKNGLKSQADIVLKTEMGGKKNRELRKWSIKNKKSIIENSTLTFLMGKDNSKTGKVDGGIPLVIQKSVGGRFKTDAAGKKVKAPNGKDNIFIPNWINYPGWVGKEIDRAKTSTNQQGQTSGPQLVKRKSSKSIDDAAFADFITVPNGTPIRGRKEALAAELGSEIGLEIFRDQIEFGGPIKDAFQKNQAALEVQLADNFISEIVKQVDARPSKFSLSKKVAETVAANETIIFNAIEKRFDNGDTITSTRLKLVLKDLDLGLNLKELDELSKAIPNVIKRFLEKSDATENVNFSKVLIDEIDASEMATSKTVLFLTELSLKELDINSQAELFRSPNYVNKHRALVGDYIKTLNKKSAIRFLKWQAGHMATAGEAAYLRKRNQITKGNKDLMDMMNNAFKEAGKNIVFSGVQTGTGFKITTITVNGKAENIQEQLSTPEQSAQKVKTIKGVKTKVNISKQTFEDNADISLAESIEAKEELLDWLAYVKKNGTKVDWIMTMMSLKSNMNSMLKAAAAVKYYLADGFEDGLNRYEHLLSTDSMARYLTAHFFNIQKIDLDVLFDKYKVAIIPITMDNDLNVFRQNSSGNWDYLTQPATNRYYDATMYGYKNIAPIEIIEGENKGDLIGEEFVAFNKFTADNAAVNSANAQAMDKALNMARKLSYSRKPSKGISVYDFDDTLAFSKSQIIVTMPDGTVTKISPAEFAAQDEILSEQGASFNFDEFNKVVQGKAGPLVPRLKKAIDKFGNKNIFVLTARPQQSAIAIHSFLKELGLGIPLENIVGLQNGTPAAKAGWMVNKVAEGYNDFYFVDDALKNVKAVKEVLDVFDVNGKIQQARSRFSKSMNSTINNMIQRNKGISAEAIYSEVVARREGADKGKFKFFVPYAAEDFRGLTSYTLAGKGQQGQKDQEFFEKALIDPYTKGVAAIERESQNIINGYNVLLKATPGMKRKLGKKIGDTKYTNDQAARIYLYNKMGYEIPGLSKRDKARILELVEEDSTLKEFAEGLVLIGKNSEWIKPSEFWDVGSILKDLNDMTQNISRKEYLAEFIENVDNIFDSNTLNKLQAIYGTRYVTALKDSIRRMKSGSNRPGSTGSTESKWLNWVNNSVGTIMFFNRRSALLQMLSFTNFINWSDNNPLNAGLAFANQPLYWKTWVKIFNSNKLKQRRGGLRSDVQEQEIANQAKNSKDKASAITAYLLKIGFTPTQIADSMAIASGGATFLINRTKTYVKQGLSKADAEAKAFEDFTKISDETQQSGDPMLISSQQSSHLGRLILAFQNTPMQYTRLIKKAGQDIINRRGDFKTNVSKILYYGFIQNMIFSALSNGLFALIPGFDDEEPDEDALDKKSMRILHSMMDTILRGSGLSGAVVTALKNSIRKYNYEKDKGYNADHFNTMIELLNVSPPIGSKVRKIYSAIQTKDVYEKDVIAKRGFDLTIDGKFNISPTYDVIGGLTSAFLNLPLDRLIIELRGITEAFDERNTAWQRIAVGLGWRTWDVNAKNEEHDLIKIEAKEERKVQGKIKAKETRETNKKNLSNLENKLRSSSKYTKQLTEYYGWKKGKSISQKTEWLQKNIK